MATKKATSAASKKKSPAKKSTAKAVKKTTAKKTVSAVAMVKEKENKYELPKPSALIAEFVGVFALTGAFFALFGSGTIGILGISLALIALVIMFAVISGAHFNPAVTIALWANRKIGGLKTILYILVQCFGALVAFFVFRGIFAATNGIGLFDGSEALIIDNLINNQGVTAEAIEEAGGLAAFAEANNFASVAKLAEYLGISSFVENNISGVGLAAFLAELVGAIVFGFGAGFAYVKRHKPVVKALALGFALFAGLAISGTTAVLNPAIAAALGSFAAGWSTDLSAMAVDDIMWPIVTYVIATVAGVVIGLTAYRFLLKDACGDKCEENCDCGC